MNQQEQPIIIVDKKGFELIQTLADLAFRGAGINAYTIFDTIIKSTQSYGQFVTQKEEEIKNNLKSKKK